MSSKDWKVLYDLVKKYGACTILHHIGNIIDDIGKEKYDNSRQKIKDKIVSVEDGIPDDIGEHIVGYDKQLGALEAYREVLKELW